MRWTPGGESRDIEDRRSQGSGSTGFGGMGGLGGLGALLLSSGIGRRLGLGGVLAILLLGFIVSHLGNRGPSTAGQYASPNGAASRTAGRVESEDQEVKFVSFVLDDAQNNWDKLLPTTTGVPYRHAKLVLFRDYTASACGAAQSATGPFYCPADEKVYLDLGFFDQLANQMGAPGEFAQAYVIAHELGHHVQKLLGIESKVRQLRRSNSPESNSLSVRMELQADCLAGVWGHSTQQRQIIDQADISAGLDAVAAVGDDRIQKMARGYVTPDSFTHGTSEERSVWFRRGLESGEIASCNTFSN
jgi:uncharacterized protein